MRIILHYSSSLTFFINHASSRFSAEVIAKNISGYFIIRENPFHTFNFNHNLCHGIYTTLYSPSDFSQFSGCFKDAFYL